MGLCRSPAARPGTDHRGGRGGLREDASHHRALRHGSGPDPIPPHRPLDPSWDNDFLPGLDGAAIYAFLRDRAPSRYVEVGSGNSTKFAARARRDGRLPMHITSIDPRPREEVDRLCDVVVRRPLEAVGGDPFRDLEAGDVVFVDGSHRVFTNSDATIFFLEVLPGLRPGVLVGVHDVYLPYDYPPKVVRRHYSEQYLLAAYLLGAARVEPVLACEYVRRHPSLPRILDPLWSNPALARLSPHGTGFWMETLPATADQRTTRTRTEPVPPIR